MTTTSISRVRGQRPRKKGGGDYVRLAENGGKWIRLAREEKRWTQRDLAQLVRRKHATIGYLERGEMTTCTRALAEDICFHLGLKLGMIFIETDKDRIPATARNNKAAA